VRDVRVIYKFIGQDRRAEGWGGGVGNIRPGNEKNNKNFVPTTTTTTTVVGGGG